MRVKFFYSYSLYKLGGIVGVGDGVFYCDPVMECPHEEVKKYIRSCECFEEGFEVHIKSLSEIN